MEVVEPQKFYTCLYKR